jgi:hypothetical protein
MIAFEDAVILVLTGLIAVVIVLGRRDLALKVLFSLILSGAVNWLARDHDRRERARAIDVEA